jgi:hypothetical protein
LEATAIQHPLDLFILPPTDGLLCSGYCLSPLSGLRAVSDSKPTFSLVVRDARSVSNAR